MRNYPGEEMRNYPNEEIRKYPIGGVLARGNSRGTDRGGEGEDEGEGGGGMGVEKGGGEGGGVLVQRPSIIRKESSMTSSPSQNADRKIAPSQR